MNGTSGTQSIQVCMLTYKRPEMLKLALESLLRQELGDCPLRMSVLVVDNDSAQSGKLMFDAVTAAGADAANPSIVGVRYVCEEGRGISAARNCALRESHGMDFIAFIDDDEVADARWVVSLYAALQAGNADIATGPVVPIYDNAPEWVVRGGFFDMAPHAAGDAVSFVATNNVMFRGILGALFQFDNRFDTTGGEDTHFFMRMRNAGCSIAWASDAIVREHIPADRANAPWLLKRARSEANRYTRCCLDLKPGVRTRAVRSAKALMGLAAGLVLLPAAMFGEGERVRALRWMNRAAGTFAGLRGDANVYYPAELPSAFPGASLTGGKASGRLGS